jgi:O-antigen/teichoic acid export membrane protein
MDNISEKSNGIRYQIKKLGKHTAIYGLGTALGRAISFLLIPLYTHFLTPKDYGVLQLVYLTTEFISILIGLRLSATVFKFFHEAGDIDSRKSVVSTAMIGVIVLGTAIIGVLLFSSSWLSELILGQRDDRILISIALFTLWLQLPIGVFNSYIQVKEKSILFVSISVVRVILSASLNIYFVAFLKIGVLGILLSGLLIECMAFLVAIPYLLSNNGLRFSWHWCKRMLRYSLPLIPASVSSIITHASDRYFIRIYMSLADTGVYTLGYKLGNSIHSFCYVPFSQIWNARRFAIEKDPDAGNIYARICTYFVALMSFVGLGMSIFSIEIINIMAPVEYVKAAKIMPLIVLCYIIYAMEDHLSTGLWLRKRTEGIALASIVSGVFCIILNFVLIPEYGTFGAVISTLISFCSRDIILFWSSNKVYYIPFEWGRLSVIFLICITLYVLTLYISFLCLPLRILVKMVLWASYPVIFIKYTTSEKEKAVIKSINTKLKNKAIGLLSRRRET